MERHTGHKRRAKSWLGLLQFSEKPYASQFKGQCTWYAWGRANELTGIVLAVRGDAWTFLDKGNVQPGKSTVDSSSEPTANSIAIWGDVTVTDPKTKQKLHTGHAAYVERVDGNNVYFTEANVSPAGVYDGLKVLTKQQFESRTLVVGESPKSITGYVRLTSASIVKQAAVALVLSDVIPHVHPPGQYQIDLYGTGFSAGTKIIAKGSNWSSNSIPVSFIDSKHLQATIVINTATTFSVHVQNPDAQISVDRQLQTNGASASVSKATTNVPASGNLTTGSMASPMTKMPTVRLPYTPASSNTTLQQPTPVARTTPAPSRTTTQPAQAQPKPQTQNQTQNANTNQTPKKK